MNRNFTDLQQRQLKTIINNTFKNLGATHNNIVYLSEMIYIVDSRAPYRH